MNQEELINMETLRLLLALTKDNYIPTKLELDRFIRSQGYRLVPDLKPLSDEEMKAINAAMPPEAKYGEVFKVISQATVDSINRQLEGK